jgi:SAM-dependent methyltransferase
MRSMTDWRPTKYVVRGHRLRSAVDPHVVNVGSRLMVDLIAARYEEAIRAHCRGALLDLGCGRAPLYGLYREFAETITCVDWANSPHEVRHADVLCDLNQPIPLPDASFDTIIFSDVMEHLYRPQQAMLEIRRLLRPGGTLLMNVPFLYWIHEQPHDFHRYTSFALERMVGDAGLDLIEIRELGGAPEVLADLVAKVAMRIRGLGRPLAVMVQSLCGWWVGTSLGGRVSAATAKQWPLGYFLIARAG